MDPVRILIVDDEEDLISTMAERLELRGFQVDTATTGAGALELVAESAYSVLILDVKMPGISGLDLMTRIKEQQPNLPVILFTGHSSLADAQKGTQQGAFAYLLKPIKIDEMMNTIKNAIGGDKDPVPPPEGPSGHPPAP
ncbi:MAG: response regulator [Planctomycetota bacterium]|jgi:DNA-binding NtrC family response regulator